MQLDVTQVILDYRGQPLLDPKGEAYIVRDILITALSHDDKQKPELSYDVAGKQRAYAASVALFASKKVNLKSDVIELIKPRLNALYSPLICGQIIEMLDDETRTIGKHVEVSTAEDKEALEPEPEPATT